MNHSLPREREKKREAGVVREHFLVRVSFAIGSSTRPPTKVRKRVKNRDTVLHEAHVCVCFVYLLLTVYQQDSVLCCIS